MKKEKMTKEQLVEIIKENFYDAETKTIDLSGIDWGYVTLNQDGQKVRILHQNNQEVYWLYQQNQKLNHLDQSGQELSTLMQTKQKVRISLVQNDQIVEGSLSQYDQKVNCLYQLNQVVEWLNQSYQNVNELKQIGMNIFKETKMKKVELVKIIKENFYDEKTGVIDLSGIDWGWNMTLNLSGQKAGALNQTNQDVEYLFQQNQKVIYLNQSGQEVNELNQEGQNIIDCLYQKNQKVKKIDQDEYKFIPNEEEATIDALNRLVKEINKKQVAKQKTKYNVEESCYRVLEALTDAYIYLHDMDVNYSYILHINSEIHTVANFLLNHVLQFEGTDTLTYVVEEDNNGKI